jgi:hypothetical protein
MALGTALAVGSAASSAIGAGMSFAQAARNRKLQLEAESAAEKALSDAKRELEVNYYDQLSVPMQAYELERDANLVAAAQAIEAGRESERGGVATAGRIQMAVQDAQQKAAADVEQQLMDLERLSATEDARLANERRAISLAESAGAQQAAADYQSMAAQSMQAGFGALTQGLGSALGREDFFALYGKVNPATAPAAATTTRTPSGQIVMTPNAAPLVSGAGVSPSLGGTAIQLPYGVSPYGQSIFGPKK